MFLFDEPLSNLDAALRVQTRLEIAKLHQELKSTIVYVTHDQVEAMTLADKIVVMNGGNVEQVGSPMQLYHHPQTRFVAGFIGSPAMNFTNVRIDKVERGKVTVSIPGGTPSVLPFDVDQNEVGNRVTVRAPGHSRVKIGETVTASASAGAAHLFNGNGKAFAKVDCPAEYSADE